MIKHSRVKTLTVDSVIVAVVALFWWRKNATGARPLVVGTRVR
jgi:predicted RNase H-like nuclease